MVPWVGGRRGCTRRATGLAAGIPPAARISFQKKCIKSPRAGLTSAVILVRFNLAEMQHMANNLVFFAIHADDLPRVQRFYEKVFGWKFQAWGPPGFFLIATGDQRDPGVQGALQKRHELVP